MTFVEKLRQPSSVMTLALALGVGVGAVGAYATGSTELGGAVGTLAMLVVGWLVNDNSATTKTDVTAAIQDVAGLLTNRDAVHALQVGKDLSALYQDTEAATAKPVTPTATPPAS